MNYEELNRIIKEFVDEEYITEDEFIFIRQLIDIILGTHVPSNSTKYHSHIRFNTSLKHSLNFLETIGIKYRANLENLFANKQVEVMSGQELSKNIVRNGKSVIQLYKRGTIEDSYTLTHENMHDMNRNLNKITVNWHLMTETISILAELLQRDYFKRLDNPPRDYRLNELDTLYALLIKACQLDFEIKLICRYLEYGYVDEYALAECLEGKNNFYAAWVIKDICDCIDKGDLNFSLLQRNIVGGVLSSHMYERIITKPSNIQEFTILNEQMNDMSFLDTCQYLDLEVVDKKLFVLSNDSIKTLSINYQKRAKGVF